MSSDYPLGALLKAGLFGAALVASGCATTAYTPPLAQPAQNSVTIDYPREPFWKAFISALSQNFFIINNLDKETGLINVSYNGDPERFVDCGSITINGLAGDYTFPAAKALQHYQVTALIAHAYFTRKMTLEGRANIVVQERGEAQTGVTVNTRYALSRHITVRDQNGRTSSNQDAIGFNYGQDATFAPLGRDGPAVTCRATGAFEKFIIETAQQMASSRAP